MQPARIDLGGELERVDVVTQTCDHGVLAAELGDALLGPPGGAAFEPHLDRERLAMGDHDLAGKGLPGREGVAGGVAPGREEPVPGVGSRGRKEGEQAERDRQGNGHQPGPQSMARIGDRVAKVAAGGVLGDLSDRGLAQGGRPGLLEVVAHQLDDPQQLVADPRVRAGEQPGELL